MSVRLIITNENEQVKFLQSFEFDEESLLHKFTFTESPLDAMPLNKGQSRKYGKTLTEQGISWLYLQPNKEYRFWKVRSRFITPCSWDKRNKFGFELTLGSETFKYGSDISFEISDSWKEEPLLFKACFRTKPEAEQFIAENNEAIFKSVVSQFQNFTEVKPCEK